MLESDSISSVVDSGWQVHFNPLTMESVVGFVVVILLLCLSALISGSETAFFSLTPNDQEKLKDSKSRTHQLVLELLTAPERLLATILVTNNFVNVGIVVISTYLTHSLIDFSDAPVLGFVFELVVITFALLLFGEILPKIYANSRPLPFALRMARALSFFSWLSSPLSYTLIHSTSFVNKRMGKHKHTVSIGDISQALDLTSEEELSDDKTILEGIVKFGNISAEQIMTPRIDVLSVDIETSFVELMEIVRVNGYSRIPVFETSFDNVKGILYIKDLLPYFDKDASFRWQSLMRPPYFVPENKKIDDLLQEFQRNRVHMAIVVDEYGGTSGIITMEDVLEEIVGDMIDEFDDDDMLYSKFDGNNYLFEGKTPLNDFYRICDLDSTLFDEVRGEADTLAGLILEMKGEFPAVNERIPFGKIVFTIDSMDKRRIKKIKVTFNN